jgi:hypothetical protein
MRKLPVAAVTSVRGLLRVFVQSLTAIVHLYRSELHANVPFWRMTLLDLFSPPVRLGSNRVNSIR